MPKTIKDLPEDSRPREKLRERGAAALTDEELVSAILGMGTAGIDVRTMSRQVAALIQDQRENLTLEDLLSIPGMGLAKRRADSFRFRVGAPAPPQGRDRQGQKRGRCRPSTQRNSR
ncbi:MAG TPA: UPF0758 domain-containing protein [Blastocatellia bacterium]|nr:UPF0758 domain-containing protein [Blastocatellia bacterium]